jgi:penicillin-binding protein 1A
LAGYQSRSRNGAYDQLPRDLVNAVVAVEDSKFYQHHGYYDFFGIVRAALKNFAAGHVRQGEHDHPTAGVTAFLSKREPSGANSSKSFWRAGSKTLSASRRLWSCI